MSLEMPTRPARVRIAPSPTGDPHVGTAYIALFNKALALRTGGRFILRIEDTDRTRYVEGSERMIFESLRWLGLDPDEGPDAGGPFGPYRQSERSDVYRGAAARLLESGHAYPCFCPPERLAALRKEQEARKLQPGYDGLCRSIPGTVASQRMAAAEPFVIRLAVPHEGETTFEDALRGPVTIQNAQVDDQVLVKSDGLPTYHLANVVDDHEMQVTHVIRAEEWISSTPKHVLLYRAFGWEMPVFAHLPLLRNKDRSKISKRKNPTSLNWYREEGFLPEALLNFLGLMGYSMDRPGGASASPPPPIPPAERRAEPAAPAADEREVFTFEEFVADFDPKRLKTTGPVFDLQKLEWLNGEWIRRLPVDELVRRIERFFGDRYSGDRARLARVVVLARERMKRLKDFEEIAGIFYGSAPTYDITQQFGSLPRERTADMLRFALSTLGSLPSDDFTAKRIDAAFREAAVDAGMTHLSLPPDTAQPESVKRAPLEPDEFTVLRVALTGRRASPPLFETMEVLGREETVERLQHASERASMVAPSPFHSCLLPRSLDPEVEKKLTLFSARLDQVVDNMLKLVVHVSRLKGNELKAPATFMLRHCAELLDAISILMRWGAADPCSSLLRDYLEASWSLEYLLQDDSERRAAAYMVTYIHDKLTSVERLDSQSGKGRSFADTLRSDRYLKGLEPTHVFDTATVQAEIAHYESQLTSATLQGAEAEYQRAKQLGSVRWWFSLFDGPKNVQALARAVGHSGEYEVMYRRWSRTTHATGVHGRMIVEKDLGISIPQVRHVGSAQDHTLIGIGLGVSTIRVVIDHLLQTERRSFVYWYCTEIKPFLDYLTTVQVLTVED